MLHGMQSVYLFHIVKHILMHVPTGNASASNRVWPVKGGPSLVIVIFGMTERLPPHKKVPHINTSKRVPDDKKSRRRILQMGGNCIVPTYSNIVMIQILSCVACEIAAKIIFAVIEHERVGVTILGQVIPANRKQKQSKRSKCHGQVSN